LREPRFPHFFILANKRNFSYPDFYDIIELRDKGGIIVADNNTQNLEIMDKLFTAVDTIVSKRIENLPYDKTITATITNIDHADEGAYIVDDGTTTFAAYSENTDY